MTSDDLLGVSQLDKMSSAHEAAAAEASVQDEFASLRAELGDGLGEGPVRLDYRRASARASLVEVRLRLAQAAEAVARDWYVPASYERLADVVRRLVRDKEAARELPILTQVQLLTAIKAEVRSGEGRGEGGEGSAEGDGGKAEGDGGRGEGAVAGADAEEGGGFAGLRRMLVDPQLLQRAIEYLEAVGEVMSDERLGCLLLDPVGWFANFLAHFIRDDGNPPAEVVRGVVSLDNVVGALQHEYAEPAEQVPAVMTLVCRLELCVPHAPDGLICMDPSAPPPTAFLFPCLLPAATASEISRHWPNITPPSALASSESLWPVVRAHRFRAVLGFLPPGLFPTLLARLMRLPKESTHAARLWSNAAVLHFREARVLLRQDVTSATLDIVAAAPLDAYHFVGAAKGQASVTRWMAHLVRTFLRRSYAQLQFDEMWLCPSPECHGLRPDGRAASPEPTDAAADTAAAAAAVDPIIGRAPPPVSLCAAYTGSEFALVRAEMSNAKARTALEHVCEHEGCWRFLGVGHALEPMVLRDEPPLCASCGREASFPLRAGAQFGWGNRVDADSMRAGLMLMQPCLGVTVDEPSSSRA